MNGKPRFGAPLTSDPDDAPELLAGFFEDAEIRQGETVIRPARNRGRPRSDARKEQISVRLDPEVIAELRKAGPGWLSRVNDLLRKALSMPAER